ncbi:hypothetical protein OWV82_009431 [Melia azedarach]|uniref:Uncharacterized protein n=1 Tax=Melia azedarach TaxID=155640 RepID=A0ACC1YE65_MELAZ|nr:hypothetical protein OWV82_009431 [Melia azedarach]
MSGEGGEAVKSWCEAWAVGGSGSTEPGSSGVFSILIDVWLDERHGTDLLTMTRYQRRRFTVDRDELVNNKIHPFLSWIKAEAVLLGVYVTRKPSVVQKILKCARKMAGDPKYSGYKVLNMNVCITIDQDEKRVPEPPGDHYYDVLREEDHQYIVKEKGCADFSEFYRRNPRALFLYMESLAIAKFR